MIRGFVASIPLTVLLVATAPLFAAYAQAETSAVTVLADNQEAMHWPSAVSLEMSYTFSGFGLTGVASRNIDLASGAFVENMSAGPVSIGSGYDGEIPWMKDFSGAYTLEQGGDRLPALCWSAIRRYGVPPLAASTAFGAFGQTSWAGRVRRPTEFAGMHQRGPTNC